MSDAETTVERANKVRALLVERRHETLEKLTGQTNPSKYLFEELREAQDAIDLLDRIIVSEAR